MDEKRAHIFSGQVRRYLHIICLKVSESKIKQMSYIMLYNIVLYSLFCKTFIFSVGQMYDEYK